MSERKILWCISAALLVIGAGFLIAFGSGGPSFGLVCILAACLMGSFMSFAISFAAKD